VLALFGRRVPSALRVFLLSLAIVDDVGAIIVIAAFYSGGIAVPGLAVAVLLLGVIVVMRSLDVWWVPAYAIVGAGVWLAVFQSGVHATIAGVVLGLLAPAHALDPSSARSADLVRGDVDEPLTPRHVRTAQLQASASVPVAERLAHNLHPWTSFAIVPLFAFANAGISLGVDDVARALGAPVTLGIVLGLVAGKVVGITGSAWLAVRLRVARLPDDVGWMHVVAVAAVAGIGFTVSLFIAALAFEEAARVEEAKVGILVASVVATVGGALTLRLSRARPGVLEE
jgi:NhaA family Na+:H+ antiporter